MAYASDLLDILRQVVRETCAGSSVAVLFSGGLDSSVLAALCGEVGPVMLYTVGIAGAHDLGTAEETAARRGWRWEGIEISPDEVIRSLAPLASVIGTSEPLPVSFEMPLYLVAKRAGERRLVSGQGADELFGGYARYMGLGEAERRRCMDEDILSLVSAGSGMDRAIAARFDKEMRHPFLDPRVLDFASRLPPEQCIDGARRKVVLREVARLLALNEEAEREKKAAQYGSGIMKVMKAEARHRGTDLRALVRTLQAE
jgi:asparagine synthase (glutamine-hydrolysing)